MPTDHTEETRRTAMKLLGGSITGVLGLTGGSSARETDWEAVDDGSISQWVLRLDDVIDGEDEELSLEPGKKDVEDLQAEAETAQQPVVQTLSTMSGVAVVNQFWVANAILTNVDREQVDPHADLTEIDGVEWIHPNIEFEAPEVKQELEAMDHGQSTYGLEQVNAPDLWDAFGTKGGGATIAVLDSGVDPDHPDIDLTDWAQFDAAGRELDTDPFDNDGHGTHVAGTATGGDASGVHIGVAPEADLLGVKVLNGSGTFTRIIAGHQWAIENGADITNMSLGAEGLFDVLIEPVRNAVRAGTIVVSSSGNEGPGTSGSPANVFESFAIGSSTITREISDFSSGEIVSREDWRNPALTSDYPPRYIVPDVAAPGSNVLSSVPTGQPGAAYGRISGTSMAAPHAAGAAALLISADDSLRSDVEAVQSALVGTAVHGDGPEADADTRYGSGIIDILSAAAREIDGNAVEGTVLDADQTPLPGVTVQSTFGNETRTTDEGSFSLDLADGEHEVEVESFGRAADTTTVSVSGGETVATELIAESVVDVQLFELQPQPDVVAPGEEFTFDIQVANLENVTISLAESMSDVAAEDVTVTLNEQELTLGETEEFEEENDVVSVTVSLSEDVQAGTVGFVHEFDGPGEPIEVETGPTDIQAEPDEAVFEIVDWSSNEEIVVGEDDFLSATIQNTGDRTAEKQVVWTLFTPAGEPFLQLDTEIELQGNEESTTDFGLGIGTDLSRFLQPGIEYDHAVTTGSLQDPDDSDSATAVVRAPVYEIEQVNATLSVNTGDTFEVTTVVENTGTVEIDSSVQFSFNGELVAEEFTRIVPGESETLVFEFDTSQLGSPAIPEVIQGKYLFGLFTDQDSFSSEVFVGELNIPDRFVRYINDNGIVDSDGLRRAIRDFRDDRIGIELLREILTAFRSGDPVEE